MRALTVRCSASRPVNPVTALRKRFETMRIARLKENFSKVANIGSTDLKDFSDFVKELDQIHKDEFSKTKTSLTTENLVGSDDADENIFKEK
jgi:hypothetical protein